MLNNNRNAPKLTFSIILQISDLLHKYKLATTLQDQLQRLYFYKIIFC